MFVFGDLRFRVAVVFIFVVFPVFGLVLRRKWRLEVARREAISRLLVLAAEEAAQAEFEVSIGFLAEPSPLSPVVFPCHRVCAICYTPTSNRCARCKSVHYCSGKCQIVHWRQGHKDECHPSSVSCEINDEASSFVGNALKQSYSDDYVTQIEYDGLPCDEQGETALNGRRFFNPAFSSPYVSAKDDDAANDNYLRVEEPGHDTCISDSASDDDSLHNLNSESCDSSSTFDNLEAASNDRQIKPLEEKSYMKVDFDGSVSSSGGLKDDNLSGKTGSSGLGVSQSVKNFVEPSIPTSGFWDGTLDTSRTRKYATINNAKPKPIGAGNENLPDLKSHVQFSSELSRGLSSDVHLQPPEMVFNNPRVAAKATVKTISANKEFAAPIRCQNSTFLGSKGRGAGVVGVDERHIKSDVVSDTRERNNHKQQSLTSQKAGFSPKQSDVFSSSGLKGHSALAAKSVKAGGNAAMPSQVARSTTSVSVVRKSSMLEVVEQLRATRSSKQGDSVVRNGEKAVFAYDSFVKLYHWNKVEFRPCGLINCGNSCYANVVLQCLAFTPPLTAYLLQGLHSKACTKKEWCFTCEFERLVLKAKEVGYPQSPISILSQIKKIGSHLTHGREEDAHEFLRYAIEAMQSICLQEAEVKGFSSLEEETTLMGLTFGGYLRSKIKCTRCHGKSERQERMMDLTVDIEGDIETLEDALRQFTGTESLDGENKYNCGRCKSYEKAKKKLNILEAPNILTVVLKRFQSGKFGKLNKSIRFPEILNLAPYMRGGSDKAPIYSLYGVVVHLDIMNASFTGHYVCYLRNAQNKWFKIDDSTVNPVELDQVLNKRAYMLLYSRCSPRAPRSIRSTIVTRDLSSKVKNPGVDAFRSNGSISTSTAHTNHIPDNLGNHGYVLQLNKNHEVDSSSDDSSWFSNSDQGSTSTDSTQESNSADDFSEVIFRYNGFSRPSDSDTSSSSSSSSSSPQYMKRSPLSDSKRYSSTLHETRRTGESGSIDGGEVAFLHSNSNSQVRNLVYSSGSEADAKRLGRANPLDNGTPGVLLRRSSRRKAD